MSLLSVKIKCLRENSSITQIKPWTGKFLVVGLLLFGIDFGRARAAVREITGNVTKPVSIASDEAAIIHDATFSNIIMRMAETPETTALLNVYGLTIARNVKFLNNTVQKLICIGDSGTLIVFLRDPGDYFEIIGNTGINILFSTFIGSLDNISVTAKEVIISPQDREELSVRGYYLEELNDPDLTRGSSLLISSVKETTFRMTGNKHETPNSSLLTNYSITLLDNLDTLNIKGPVNFWFDALVRAKNIHISGNVSGEKPEFSIGIREFDQIDIDSEESYSYSSGGTVKGGIIEISSDGKLDGAPSTVRPIVLGDVTANSEGTRYNYYTYIGVVPDELDSTNEYLEGSGIELHPSSRLDIANQCYGDINLCYSVGFAEGGNDRRAVRYHFPVSTRFIYGEQTTKPEYGGNSLLVLNGAVDGPVLFKGFQYGALDITAGKAALLIGSVVFDGIANGNYDSDPYSLPANLKEPLDDETPYDPPEEPPEEEPRVDPTEEPVEQPPEEPVEPTDEPPEELPPEWGDESTEWLPEESASEEPARAKEVKIAKPKGVIDLQGTGSKLYIVLPVSGDRVLFKNTQGTVDIGSSGRPENVGDTEPTGGSILHIWGVKGTSLRLSGGIGIAAPSIFSGSMDLYLGSSTLSAYSVDIGNVDLDSVNIGGLDISNIVVHLTIKGLGESRETYVGPMDDYGGSGGHLISTALKGYFTLDPLIAVESTGTLDSYWYASGLTPWFNPEIKNDFGSSYYSINFRGGSLRRMLVLSLPGGRAISRSLPGPTGITVLSGTTMTIGENAEPVNFTDLSEEAIKIESDAKVLIRGSASFSNIGKGAGDGGAIDISGSTRTESVEQSAGEATETVPGELTVSLEEAGSFLDFVKTSARWDIHNAGKAILNGVSGTSIKLSKGIGGTDGETEISGSPVLWLGSAAIDQKKLSFLGISENSEIVISPTGVHITIQDGGSIISSKPVNIRVEITSSEAAGLLGNSDHWSYTYLTLLGDSQDESQYSYYNPHIIPALVRGKEGTFGVADDPDRDPSSLEWKSRFIIFRERKNISGLNSPRIIVYKNQIASNSGPISFEGLAAETSKNGGALLVAGNLTLDSHSDGSDRPIVFKNNSATNGGAIYVSDSGKLTIRGSANFENNSATAAGGSIYNNKNSSIRFILGAGDWVTFADVDTQPVTAPAIYNGIHNDGSIHIEGESGSHFKLGKYVSFIEYVPPINDQVDTTGRLTLEGGVELILGGTISQSGIHYYPYSTDGSINPIITVLIYDASVSTSTGGKLDIKTSSAGNDDGKALLRFRVATNMSVDRRGNAADVTHQYLTGDGAAANARGLELTMEYPPTVNGIGEPYRARLGLDDNKTKFIIFDGKNGGIIISGRQTEAMTVQLSNGIAPFSLTNWNALERVYWDKDVPNPLVTVNGGGTVFLVGPLDFTDRGPQVNGVFIVTGSGQLTLWAGKAEDSIVFGETGALADISNIYISNISPEENSNSGGEVRVLLAENAKLTLPKGIAGEGVRLFIGGAGILDIGADAKIDQETLGFFDYYGNCPILLLRVKTLKEATKGGEAVGTGTGGYINIQSGGSLEIGSVRVSVDMSGVSREHFVKGTYSYIQSAAENTLNTDFNPRALDSPVRFKDRDYDMSISADKKDIVLLGYLEGEIPEKFVITNGKEKIIQNAVFRGLQNTGAGEAGVLEIAGEGSKAIVRGETLFEDNVGGTEGDGVGAIKIAAEGTLEVRAGVEFVNNRQGGGKLSDIANLGTIDVNASGSLTFGNRPPEPDSGDYTYDGIVGDGGTLNVRDYSSLYLRGATVDQKNVMFENETDLVLDVWKFDTAGTDADGDRSTRGGVGGMLGIQMDGSLTGSPSLTISIDEIKELDNNASDIYYKYLYPIGNDSIVDFTPQFRERFIVAPGNRALEVAFATKEVEEGEEEQPDYRILHFKQTTMKDFFKEKLDISQGDKMSNGKKATMSVFLASPTVTDAFIREIQSTLDYDNNDVLSSMANLLETAIDDFLIKNNPDSNVVAQSKAEVLHVQSSSDIIADRVFLTDSLADVSAPTAELLVAAAGDDKLAYGSLKERASDEHLLSRLWLQFFGNFGSQKLDEDMKTSGFGFVLGFDRKPKDNLRLGVAYSFSKDESKGDVRERTTSTHGLSLFGDYGLGSLHLLTLLTFGLTDYKDGELSGKGNIIGISPALSYKINIKEENNMRISLAPEIGLRYFRVHQDKQSGKLNDVAAVTRNIMTLAPAVRVIGLLQNKIELGAKLGFGYDIYSGGDDSYSVTLKEGNSYQILDENDKKAKLTTELGLSAGYRISSTLRVSLGYSGRYSSDMTNNGVSLETSWKF
ncbi:MAG: autotransporter outer membrane beta-barrel domain-containing protein [Rickettsiales bacterium]|jgi:predicted outer membrane repeat protein|nr:autotransporter outer membrane beta-barrel domain-containing protein [Rickettsiales bacterium]